MNEFRRFETFFSLISSIRRYFFWNIYSFKKSGMDAVYLMHLRSQSQPVLMALTDFWVPDQLKSDTAQNIRASTGWNNELPCQSCLYLLRLTIPTKTWPKKTTSS